MVREGRSDALRKKHRAQIARTKPNCHICGRSIDYSLRFPDPMCFVVDHLVPIAKGGSDALSNKKAAHHPRLQLQETSTRLRTNRPTLRLTQVEPDNRHDEAREQARRTTQTEQTFEQGARGPGGGPPPQPPSGSPGPRHRSPLNFFPHKRSTFDCGDSAVCESRQARETRGTAAWGTPPWAVGVANHHPIRSRTRTESRGGVTWLNVSRR